MLPQWVIEKKRDGNPLSLEEIQFFVNGFSKGKIPDYQTSALAMAICIRGMNFDEIAGLTQAMLESGDVLDLGQQVGPKVDKHSTGGIGDKTSLVLAPLVASCGLIVPMISGRGLGITGGTLDKLEAIPGFRTDLNEDKLREVVDRNGCAITGTTGNIAPADKKLYALRDVTGTVPSIPLITSSILSKKLAANLDALVLDVKWGAGAFMKTESEARELAKTLTQTSQHLGTRSTALLTAMDQPLGRTAGNALEIVEVIEVLRGNGPKDLVELILALGAQMLSQGQVAEGPAATRLLEQKLKSGDALDRFRAMVEAQEGDPRVVDNPELLPAAPLAENVRARNNGSISAVNAEAIGQACLELGAGRKTSDDSINPAVGISSIRKVGEEVERGDTLAVVHAHEPATLQMVLPRVAKAFTTSEDQVESPPLISGLIEGKNGS